MTTAWVSLTGIALFYVAEPTIQALPPYERLTASAFQVMAAITTVGFNTIPVGQLSQASLFLLIMRMVVGASPSGTGGGLKTTTFTVLFGVIRSALLDRGKEDLAISLPASWPGFPPRFVRRSTSPALFSLSRPWGQIILSLPFQ